MDLDPNDIRRLIEELAALNKNITANKEAFEADSSATRASNKKASDDFNLSTRAIVNAIAALGTRIEGLSEQTKISARDRRTENQKIEDFTASVEKTTKAQIDAAQATEEREQAEKDAEEATRKRILAEEEATRIAKMTAKERQAYERQQQKIKQKADDDSNRQLLKNGLEEGNLRTQLSKKGLLEAQNVGSKFFDQMSSLGNSTDFLRDKVKDSFAGFITKMGGGTKSIIAFEASTQLAGAALQGVAKGLTSYASALYRGERGFTASAKAMTETIKPLVEFADMLGNIISFASIFVPGGLLVKGAVALGGQLLKLAGRAAEAAAKLNELQAEQLDKTFKSFREISTVGAATAGGLEDVFDSMQNLGLTTAEIEQFTEVIKTNSRTFALFGKDVGAGRMQFQDVANTLIKSNLGVELERLGMTTKEQTKATAGYMNIQARLGTLQNKSIEQLAKESARYARELDELARLTGMSREEAEQARMQAMAEDQFRAAIEMAEETGDKAFKQQLENAQLISQLLKSQGREEDAKEVLRLAASRGAPTSERQGAMLLSGYGEAIRAKNQEEALRTLEKTLGSATKQFQGIAQYVPGKELPLPYAAERDLLTLIKGKSPEETAKIVAEQMQKVSGRTEAAIGIEREQKNMAQKLDSAAFKLLDVAKMHRDASKHLNDAADTLIKWTGSKSATVAGGGFSRAGETAAAPGAAPGTATLPVAGPAPAYLPRRFSEQTMDAAGKERIRVLENQFQEQKDAKQALIDRNKKVLAEEEKELQKMYVRAESTEKIQEQLKKVQELKTKEKDLQKEFNDLEQKKLEEKKKELSLIEKETRQRTQDQRKSVALNKDVAAFDQEIAEITKKRVQIEQELKDKNLRPAYRQRKERELSDINKRTGELQADRAESQQAATAQEKKMSTSGAARPADSKSGAPTGKPVAMKSDNPISQIIDFGPGYNIVSRPEGGTEKQEGARNWRNNNPGNIEYGNYAIAMGAIGRDDRFAVFPTYSQGRYAKSSLIFDSKNYKDLDLRSAIFRYAPATENDSESYFNSVLAAAGGKNKLMAEYTQPERESILDAMERVEGFKPGKVTQVQAANGGVIKSTPGGTSVLAAEAGMSEAFVPLPDGRNIPVTLNVDELINKMALKQVDLGNSTTQMLESTVTKIVENARSTGITEESIAQLGREFSSMNDKLSQMLDVLASSKDIQSSLLTTSMS